MLPAERQVLTPSQLNALARDMLEGAFPLIWVEGELSGVSRPASGHVYFTLKDARAQVRCALFKPKSQWLKFRPADGMHVLLRARLTVYEARGDYQLIVEHMEEAGEGALLRAFEALKARLQAEGLFAAERKRPLPRFVRRLGILSSPSGAAIRDVISILRRRFPLLEVELLPVPVQGDGAAAQIVRLLQRADASGRYDVLLVTRGGGSLEDLFAFNDEALARAIVASTTPVVSAVGHEIDVSIADFAADLRAATPSAAAELLTPDAAALRALLTRRRQQLALALRRVREHAAFRVDQLQQRLTLQHPALRLQHGAERLLALRLRLQREAVRQLERRVERTRRAGVRLSHRQPQLHALGERTARAGERQRAAMQRLLERRRQKLLELGRALTAVSPLATLERGYAIVLDERGNVLRHADALSPGQRVQARFVDGTRWLRSE
ncbi:exodeoxyribonuclease VII large subunit [Chiayiivirga flava]|uniref:exodeoxyribonuclease VII large subunit n=1 Tax=Chiayiivirga flava TaxID=659595 RepID=UPI003CCCBDB2